MDAFESDFAIWQVGHRISLGMRDSRGNDLPEAKNLMVRWQKMFRKHLQPPPALEELSDATDYMCSQRELAEASWKEHYSILLARIRSERTRRASAKKWDGSLDNWHSVDLPGIIGKIGKDIAS